MNIATKHTNLYCIRFNFGVPLEDIFPPTSIHPKLHHLFRETSLAFTRNSASLSAALGDFGASIHDVLALKAALLAGRLSYKKSDNPAAYFGLIRYFFGLLPLPLFTQFAYGLEIDWKELAGKCRKCRVRRHCILDIEITRAIHSLPPAHTTMIYYFVSFFRRQIVRDRRDIILVTKYFTPVLFPSKPSLEPAPQVEKLYNFLMYYIFVHWPYLTQAFFPPNNLDIRRPYPRNLPVETVIEEVEEEVQKNVQSSATQTECETKNLSTQTPEVCGLVIEAPIAQVTDGITSENVVNESPHYRQFCDEIFNADSQTKMIENNSTSILKAFNYCLTTPNHSLRKVVSKLSDKLKTVEKKHKELATPKYSLLETPVSRTKSLPRNSEERSGFKYKKLQTF